MHGLKPSSTQCVAPASDNGTPWNVSTAWIITGRLLTNATLPGRMQISSTFGRQVGSSGIVTDNAYPHWDPLWQLWIAMMLPDGRRLRSLSQKKQHCTDRPLRNTT